MNRFLFAIIILTFSLSAFSQPQQSFNGTTGNITDNQTWNQYPCTVTGLGQTNINTLWGFEKLTISISHNNDADLEVRLQAPDGTEVLIFNNVGGTGNNFTNTGFKNTYTTPIAQGTAPFTGSFKPQGDLGQFNNGQPGNGTWLLKIRDNNPGTQGTVVSWAIRFGNGPAIPQFVLNTNLPIIKINTYGNSIPDEPKLGAWMQVIDNGAGLRNTANDSIFAFEGNIGIELRGSSSGSAPKASYGFETWDSAGSEVDTALLGMPAQSDWILSASYYDKTLMRNVLSYRLFNSLGHYAPRTRYCEVLLNDQYQGVYMLMEKIKRDENRVDIAKLSPEDTTGDQLTGGYIIKIDKFTGSGGDGFYSNYPSSNSNGSDAIFYQYEYPKPLEIAQQQKDYIRLYVDSFETALFGAGFQHPVTGFRQFGGEHSFLDYMLINEMSKNVDGYRLSTFFHKDKRTKGGKLKAGPTWDYDIAWMNADYCQAQIDTGWAYNLDYVCQGAAVPAFWERMRQDTLFNMHLRCRWQQLRQTTLSLDSLFAYIDTTVAYINEGQQRNFVQWPILGVGTWPEPTPLPQTYQEEIQRLKDWITTRFDWMDMQIYNLPVLNFTPNLGTDTAFCSGGALVLDAGDYHSYQWGNGYSGQLLNVTQPGTYSVTVSDEFGCTGGNAVNVVAWPLPDSSFTQTVTGARSYSFAYNTGGLIYQWNFGDGATDTAQNPNHVYQADGVYTVTLNITDSKGCQSVASNTITITTTGINQPGGSSIVLYPNPATNRLFITGPPGLNQIAVYNAIGQQIPVSASILTQPAKLDISHLPAGLYWVEIKTTEGTFSRKFQK